MAAGGLCRVKEAGCPPCLPSTPLRVVSVVRAQTRSLQLTENLDVHHPAVHAAAGLSFSVSRPRKWPEGGAKPASAWQYVLPAPQPWSTQHTGAELSQADVYGQTCRSRARAQGTRTSRTFPPPSPLSGVSLSRRTSKCPCLGRQVAVSQAAHVPASGRPTGSCCPGVPSPEWGPFPFQWLSVQAPTLTQASLGDWPLRGGSQW